MDVLGDNDWPLWDPTWALPEWSDKNENKPVDPDSWANTKDDWNGD